MAKCIYRYWCVAPKLWPEYLHLLKFEVTFFGVDKVVIFAKIYIFRKLIALSGWSDLI